MDADLEYIKKLAAFAKLSNRIFEQTGIRPTDFDTADEYIVAVLSVTTTSSLSSWSFDNDETGFEEMVKNELKKRGEM